MNTKINTITIKNKLKEIDAETLKIKILETKEFKTSLDRLSRFKHPLLNQQRIKESLITKNLIYPKLNLKQIRQLKQFTVNRLAEIIWNHSTQETTKSKQLNKFINIYLAFEETKTFSSKVILEDLISIKGIFPTPLPLLPDVTFKNHFSNTLIKEKLITKSKYISIPNISYYDEVYINICINNCYDIENAIKLITKNAEKETINIKRLIKLSQIIENKKLYEKDTFELDNLYNSLITKENFNFGYPIKTLLLVEGATEAKLLPIFAKKQGLNFNQKGIQLIAPGGKNPTLKYYNEIKNLINIPVFILLDADAVDIKEDLDKILRPQDTLYLIPEGEFEDILPNELICKSVNNFYKSEGSICKEDLVSELPMASWLHELWKEKGFGEFSKAKFAEIISKNINNPNDLSPSLKDIIENIKKLLNY